MIVPSYQVLWKAKYSGLMVGVWWRIVKYMSRIDFPKVIMEVWEMGGDLKKE